MVPECANCPVGFGTDGPFVQCDRERTMQGMKRTAVALLWGYAFWYAGAMLASVFNAPEVFGPILGVATGVLVAVDPRGHFWSKSAKTSTTSSERTVAPAISMTKTEATR